MTTQHSGNKKFRLSSILRTLV